MSAVDLNPIQRRQLCEAAKTTDLDNVTEIRSIAVNFGGRRSNHRSYSIECGKTVTTTTTTTEIGNAQRSYFVVEQLFHHKKELFAYCRLLQAIRTEENIRFLLFALSSEKIMIPVERLCKPAVYLKEEDIYTIINHKYICS